MNYKAYCDYNCCCMRGCFNHTFKDEELCEEHLDLLGYFDPARVEEVKDGEG